MMTMTARKGPLQGTGYGLKLGHDFFGWIRANIINLEKGGTQA